jgi:predicted transcriptional regulator
MDRTDLHKLVEDLPETEIPTAIAFLSFVTHRAQQTPLDRILDSAPYEDEELTEEEHAGIREGLEDIRAGRVYTAEEIEKELLG